MSWKKSLQIGISRMPEKGFLCAKKIFYSIQNQSTKNNHLMLLLLSPADHSACVEGAYDVDRIVLSRKRRSRTASQNLFRRVFDRYDYAYTKMVLGYCRLQVDASHSERREKSVIEGSGRELLHGFVYA